MTDLPHKKPADGLETYNTIAETVGGVPTLRVKDNVIQAVAILLSLVLGVIIGFAVGGVGGALAGAFAGLLAGLLISGTVLMVVGWLRAAKKL